MSSYSSLKSAVRECRRCPLNRTRNKAVPGAGRKSDICFIGEGPGFYENIKGVPFCGEAGRVLNELLNSIGLSRLDVFVCNVICCWPGRGNRDPLPTEIEACRPWLDAQIALADPRFLVCLGRISTSLFFPHSRLRDLHGRAIQRDDGVILYSMYHPAAALHNRSMRRYLDEDFAKLGALIGSEVIEL